MKYHFCIELSKSKELYELKTDFNCLFMFSSKKENENLLLSEPGPPERRLLCPDLVVVEGLEIAHNNRDGK